MKKSTVFVVASIFTFSVAQAWEQTVVQPMTERAQSEGTRTFDDSVAVAVPQYFVLPFPTEEVTTLGHGYDLLTNRRKLARCVNDNNKGKIPIMKQHSSLYEITDEEVLTRKLNYSLEGRASYAGYSGGGSTSSSIETKSASTKKVILVGSDIFSYSDFIEVPKIDGTIYQDKKYPALRVDLTPKALELYKKDRVAFRDVCGDGFVQQINYGGEMYATFEFTGLSYEQNQSLIAAINASGPANLFSVNGTSKSEETYKNLSNKTNIKYSRSGGGGAFNPVNKEDLLDIYKNFPKELKNNERAFSMVVVRYTDFASVSEEFTMSDISKIETLIRIGGRANSILNEIDDLIVAKMNASGSTSEDYFIVPSFDTPLRDLNGLRDLRKNILSVLSDVSNGLAACMPKSGNKKVCQTIKIPAYNDYAYRAKFPLAFNVISEIDRKGIISNAASKEDTLKTEAACAYGLFLKSELRKLAAARKKLDGFAPTEDVLQEAELEVDKSLVNGTACSGAIVQQIQANYRSLK
ncbi:hypothetical protein [Ottowia sp. SB7-C50]|uniref:hypothetical protein n=1 Tax=Ottowia sp. SB7-C50 TaxID=3081231 RepID=UPI0029540C16|nr:hypothetical protein [Ottowia sp. SB7-C50]WOP16956.1 hypothetical protein R0D99_08265 [Ottowia sp. SB7-C50]